MDPQAIQHAGLGVNPVFHRHNGEVGAIQLAGIRVGVPAVTTRGMKEEHMETVVGMIDKVLMNADDEAVIGAVKAEVRNFMQQFPLYPELD